MKLHDMPAAQRAKDLKPFEDQPLRRRSASGPKLWHGVTGNRFAMNLPAHVDKQGPIRARDVRREKNPTKVDTARDGGAISAPRRTRV